MFKSKRIIISLFLMLAACGIMFAVLFKTSDAAITKKQFEAAKTSQNFVYDVHMRDIISSKTVVPNNKNPKELLNSMIDNEVLYQQAKKENCAVSYSTAKKFSEYSRKLIHDKNLYKSKKFYYILLSSLHLESWRSQSAQCKNFIDFYIDKTVYKDFKKYVAGIEYNENKYWRKIIPECQKKLSINKLKNKIKLQIPKEDKKDAAKVQSVIQKYTNKIKQDYKILIFKNKL